VVRSSLNDGDFSTCGDWVSVGLGVKRLEDLFDADATLVVTLYTDKSWRVTIVQASKSVRPSFSLVLLKSGTN
jgi:hypothetical protein